MLEFLRDALDTFRSMSRLELFWLLVASLTAGLWVVSIILLVKS